MHVLHFFNFFFFFSITVLDFAQLHRVVNILHDNSVADLHLPTLLTSGTGSRPFVTQCEMAIDYLIRHGQFSEAQELTKVAGISQEKVTFSQVLC